MSYLLTVCTAAIAPLTLPLVNEKKNSNTKLVFNNYYKTQRRGHEQIIVLSKVLNDEVNVGYHGWSNMILKSVNGHVCQNIQELVNALTMKIEDETLEFHFENTGNVNSDGEADWGEFRVSSGAFDHYLSSSHFLHINICLKPLVVCMNMEEVAQSESRILSRHMIASWCSSDAISHELYSKVVETDFPDAEKSASWSTMGGLRKILFDK